MGITPESSSSAGAIDLERLMVLIVDDDNAIREALSELLEDEGYRVATATDGRDALDQLRRGMQHRHLKANHRSRRASDVCARREPRYRSPMELHSAGCLLPRAHPQSVP